MERKVVQEDVFLNSETVKARNKLSYVSILILLYFHFQPDFEGFFALLKITPTQNKTDIFYFLFLLNIWLLVRFYYIFLYNLPSKVIDPIDIRTGAYKEKSNLRKIIGFISREYLVIDDMYSDVGEKRFEAARQAYIRDRRQKMTFKSRKQRQSENKGAIDILRNTHSKFLKSSSLFDHKSRISLNLFMVELFVPVMLSFWSIYYVGRECFFLITTSECWTKCFHFT